MMSSFTYLHVLDDVISCFRMPVLFETIGTLGRVIAVLFFLSLSFAGITSLMSNFELVTKTLQDFGRELIPDMFFFLIFYTVG